MLIMTEIGLFCPRGNFYIDPRKACDTAIVTHAHSDHAFRGSKQYICTTSGRSLLALRLGKISITTYDYRETFVLNGVKISFHPAGHILGSSQVRIELDGDVWVVSGDYKRELDASCEPFEIVPCHTFVTEATFGTPAYTWRKDVDLGAEIYTWWQQNKAAGLNSVIFAYSLGKSQRILNLLHAFAKEPIYCHQATEKINQCYREANIQLADTIDITTIADDEILKEKLIITPSAFMQSPKAVILGEKYKTAFASGWVARGFHENDHGFLISDHADWNDLVETVTATGAKEVYVQHRGKGGALIKKLKTLGIKAYPDTRLLLKQPNQRDLFYM